MTIVEFWELVQNGSVVGLMVVIVWGALKEWWVPGKVHRRMVREMEMWRTLALKSTTLAEKAVTLAAPPSEEEL